MRRIVVAGVSLIAVGLTASPARAATGDHKIGGTPVVGSTGGGVTAGDSSGGGGANSGTGAGAGATGSGGGSGAGGPLACAGHNTPGPSFIPPCVQVPATPGTPAPPPPPTAQQIAQSWSAGAPLPGPTLSIQPGYAVTGLTAYLVITNQNPWTTAFHDPVRNDTISVDCSPATGNNDAYVIDWGDGTGLQSTDSAGGNYPTGDVRHVYQQASSGLTITVTEHWRCTWSDALGNGGLLTGLGSTGQLRNFEVREIQGTN